jgi:hypothetical protein
MEYLLILIHGWILIGEILLIYGEAILIKMKISSDRVQYDIMYQLRMIGKQLLIFFKNDLIQRLDDIVLGQMN